MTKKVLYSVFALALLTTTVGCPPPAPEVDVNIDTTMTPAAPADDNMTAVTEVPTDAVTEVPTDNVTTGSETP